MGSGVGQRGGERKRGKGKRGMSVTRRKQGVNVLERDVMKIKIVIGEKHVHTHTHACTKRRPHKRTESPVVCFIDLI